MRGHVPPIPVDAAVRYLDAVGVEGEGAEGPSAATFARAIAGAIAGATVPVSDEALLALWRYPIPKLGPGGSCSLSHELDLEPFDLRADELRAMSISALRDHPESLRLARLAAAVAALAQETHADWAGFYRRVTHPPDEDALRKEAYVGRPSRPVFPLTEEFAAMSNNSTAALSGRGILVEDVEEHLKAGRPYYECDAAVRSELCLPVNDGNRVVGLIDLEAFVPRRFGPDERLAAAIVALAIVRTRLLVPTL